MEKTMLNSYVSNMVNFLSKRFPDKDKKELMKFVIEKSRNDINNNPNKDDLRLTYERYGIVLRKNERGVFSLADFDRYVYENNPIICGYGTFIKRQDEFENILANMIRTLKALRKEYKNEMFKHINDEDPSIYQMNDSRQKTTKVLNNSFYGATAESNSIFYHPHFGPSVTYAGEDLVTIAAKAFENFLGNNIIFRNVDDIFIYINNINREKYSTEVKFKKDIDRETLIEYLKSKLSDDTNFYQINEYFDVLEKSHPEKIQELYNKVYYKNNLFKFLDNSDIIENHFDKIVGRYDFLDPNEPPEDMIETLDNIWNIFNDYIFYNYQDFYRLQCIDSGKRRVVLTINIIGCH